MLGHWRPLFLRFQKGGKTVATAGGTFFGVATTLGLIGLAIWIVTFLVTRYASLASIVTALSLPFLGVALGEPWPVIVFASIAAVAGRLPAPREHRAPPGGHREPLRAQAPQRRREVFLGGAEPVASEVCRSVGSAVRSSARSSPTVPSRSASTS